MNLMISQMLRSLVVFAVMAPVRADPTPDEMHAPFPTESHVCEGTEIVRESCTMIPCGNCQPINCVFEEWTQWSNEPGCNGLSMRHRGVKQDSNNCGAPCDGPMIESRRVTPPAMCSSTEPVDCLLSEWSHWSQCTTSVDQSYKVRRIKIPAYNGGKACTGEMNITKPCGNPVDGTKPCQFSEWHEWTTCSMTCGGGWKTRYRRIKQKSGYAAAPCEGNMSQISTCSTAPCDSNVDCRFNTWGQWTGCDDIEPHQKMRIRTIANYASGTGASCTGHTRELAGCIKANVTDAPCILEQWSTWSACTVTCKGGQRSRFRKLGSPAIGLGACPAEPLQMIEPCGEDTCHPGLDCTFTAWAQWTACKPACGKGIRFRDRDTDSPAVQNKDVEGCQGVLREVGSCESTPCVLQDCVWGNWAEWGG